MIEFILAVLFSIFLTSTHTSVASVKPCIFPNRCGAGGEQTQVLAQFKPCVFPNRCGASERSLIEKI